MPLLLNKYFLGILFVPPMAPTFCRRAIPHSAGLQADELAEEQQPIQHHHQALLAAVLPAGRPKSSP